MGRSTEQPRLNALIPTEVANSVFSHIRRHIDILCLATGFELVSSLRIGGENGELATFKRKVVKITQWAQTGKVLTWSEAVSHIVTLASGLLSSAHCAYSAGINPTEINLDALDLDTDYGVMLLAANGRLKLMLGQDIPVRELAALSSLSVDSFSRGPGQKLKRVKFGRISNMSALNFLARREIAMEVER